MGVSEPLIQASLLGEAIENGPIAVFVADEHGSYVAVNLAACTLLGYTRDELLALQVIDLAEDGRAREGWSELRRAAGTSRLRRKDGTVVEFGFVGGATTVAGMEVFVLLGAAAT
jgi:PAS domain S-box-containing protein